MFPFVILPFGALSLCVVSFSESSQVLYVPLMNLTLFNCQLIPQCQLTRA